MKFLLIGDDFRFGQGRQGDVALLQELGHKAGCQVAICPDFKFNAERVSSTQIRTALQESDFQRVQALLGRPYSMCGRVIHGQARGREWGVPTANVNVLQQVLPLNGVFCVKVQRAGHDGLLQGVANIGQRPTLDGTRSLLEVHLFDVNESLYGERLQVFFLHKLRDEVKFSSLDALIAQIHADVLSAKSYFQE